MLFIYIYLGCGLTFFVLVELACIALHEILIDQELLEELPFSTAELVEIEALALTYLQVDIALRFACVVLFWLVALAQTDFLKKKK